MSIDLTIADGVAEIVINRPERLNALDEEHYRALSAAWQRVRDGADVRAAIISGAGERAFSTGADLKSYINREIEWAAFWRTQENQLLNRGLEVWKPIIAAVHGHCVGGGLTLLLATDIRVASTTASFALSEVRRGVIAANGGTQRLLRQLPHAIGMEMLLTGAPIDAAAAERWGLVNRVVEPALVMQAARAYAAAIAANAPLAVQASKELALRGLDLPLEAGLRLEQAMSRLVHATHDAHEGPAAFAEKRPARFEGR